MGQCCEKANSVENPLNPTSNETNFMYKSLRRSTKQMDIDPNDHIPSSDYAEPLEYFEPKLTPQQKSTLIQVPSLIINKNTNSAQSLIQLPHFYELSDGSVYQGTWLCGFPHGRGVFFCEDHIYEGTVAAGEYFGTGRKVLLDGEIQIGEYIKGELTSGEIIFPNKHRFIGNFKDGLLEGECMEIWPDGAVYKGEFMAGLRCGFGKLFYENDNSNKRMNLCRAMVREFKCRKNEPFPPKTKFRILSLKLPDKNIPSSPHHSVYSELSESFQSSVLHISNTNPFENFYKSKGEYYEGEWEGGHFQGKGIYRWLDGRYYEGEWSKGLMHGQGEFHWPNGTFYKGAYIKDMKQGYGEFYWPDGKVWKGNWIKGKPIEGKISNDRETVSDENRLKSFKSYLGLLEESFEVTNKSKENRKISNNPQLTERGHNDISISIMEENYPPCTDENVFPIALKSRITSDHLEVSSTCYKDYHVKEADEEESGNIRENSRPFPYKHKSMHHERKPNGLNMKKNSDHYTDNAGKSIRIKVSDFSRFLKENPDEKANPLVYEEFSLIENFHKYHVNPTILPDSEELFVLQNPEGEEAVVRESDTISLIEFTSYSNDWEAEKK